MNRTTAGPRPRPQRAGGRGVGKGQDHQAKNKQGKRVTFPWINQQIIAAADSEDLQHLMLAINTHLPQMNLVNISTALHRIAKLSGNSHAHSQGLLQQTRLALLAAARQALIRSEETGATPKCQTLSNITWALATMQVVDFPLLELVLPRAYNQLTEFKNFELCQLLWAFAKLGTVNPALCESSALLFSNAAEFVVWHLEEFTFRGLVMTAWAFATAKQSDSKLFRAISTRLLPSVHQANCQELANTAWAFSTAGVFEERLFEMLAHVATPYVREFKPQELSSIMWSFASIGYCCDDFYEAAGRAAMQMELQAQQLANILWSLTKMRPHHDSTREALLCLLPWCTVLIATFKTQELASVALAAGKCFGTSPGSEESQESSQPLPFQVATFFHAALPLALPNLREYSGQSLANIASSFLAVQVGATSGLFAAVSYEIMSRAESLENSALLLLLKTLPQAPQSAPVDSALCQLFAEAARRVDSLSSREFQALARAVKHLGGGKEADLTNREELRVWLLSLATEWRSGDMPSRGNNGVASSWQQEAAVPTSGTAYPDNGAAEEEDTNAALDRWAPSITLTVNANTGRASAWDEEAMQQLCDVMEATAARREEVARERAGADGAGAVESAGAQASPNRDQSAQQQKHFVFSVKNTFLDVEEGSDDGGSDSEFLNMPLPPALPFIPDSVSAEKLQTYRANYARFRVGNAIGAKGELDTVS